MSILASALQRSPAPFRAEWAKHARRVLRALQRALNRLVPPHPRDDTAPPAEWFKYPPI